MTSKTFRDYLDQNDYRPQLKSDSKSIPYLEDLAIKDFIESIKNLDNCIAAEKLDGTALTFGLDDGGKFYTTRSGKGSFDSLFYKAEDWGVSAASNGFKAAHAALIKHNDKIKKVMEPGEAMDIEILFGRQPNTIVYGLDGYNYIAFLKMTSGTNKDLKVDQEKVKKLINLMKDETSDIRTKNVDTSDGVSLSVGQTVSNWKFTAPEFIDPKKFDDKEIKDALKEMEDFLAKKHDEMSSLLGKDMTNLDAATKPLTDVKVDKRPEAKALKQKINEEIQDKHKIKIKNLLLEKFVKTVKPRLQDNDVKPDEDLGMEGLVVLNPKTQQQFKIVDKELFTALNRFNYQVRNTIRGIVRNDDEEAPLEQRGGLLGTAKIRIANLFNMPGLGKGYSTKKVIQKFKGSTPEETVSNIAKSLKDADYMAFKEKIHAVIDYTLEELQETLDNFKQKQDTYKIKLDNGKEVGYTQEIVRRTLLVFAETRESLLKMREKIENAKSMEDIIVGMFGKTVKQLFGDMPEAGEAAITEEEGGVAVDGGGESTPTLGTTSSAIATFPKLLFPGKMIRRVIKQSVKYRKKKRTNK